jgi:hypothetical protein
MKSCIGSVCTALLAVLTVAPAYAQSSTTRQIALAGKTFIRSTPVSSSGAQGQEVDISSVGSNRSRGGDFSTATNPGSGVPTPSSRLASSNPELNLSFDGLTYRDHRLANGGNQLNHEPPDQGLCVGNGFVLESVNSVLRVYDTNGNALTGVTDFHTFYGYPAEYNNATGEVGPWMYDPYCYFDPDTQHWFHLVGTADRVGTSFAFAGPNHLDLAVSQTSSPIGAWNIYKIPTQNDGTEGTPNHHCTGGPCANDYAKMGADANGIYISSNEYPLFGPGSTGAQIYAISKQDLAKGLPSVTVIQFNTGDPDLLLDGNFGFTVWPATTPASKYANDLGGTEYFLSSVAIFDNGSEQRKKSERSNQSDNRLRIWALSNTQSLNTNSPALVLRHGVIDVETYTAPQYAGQKVGDVPLADCLNDSTVSTPFGTGCWNYFGFAKKPAGTEREAQDIQPSFSLMTQVVFADGKLWSALNTALDFGNATQVGVAYFVLKPQISTAGVVGQVVQQGYFGLAYNNLLHPATGVTAKGKAAITFALTGADHFPSAAYATLDAVAGISDIHIAAEGLGPEDGLTAYKAIQGYAGFPLWGDYGATAVDGDSIWIGSEYIGQTCTFAEYVATNRTCNGTRTAVGNWYTRVSKITP